MEIDSPQYTERPVRQFDVTFVGGGSDSITLLGDGTKPDDDLLTIDSEIIAAHVKDEVVVYLKAHVAAYRIRQVVQKVRIAPPKPLTAQFLQSSQ